MRIYVIYIYWFGGLDELTVCAIDCIDCERRKIRNGVCFDLGETRRFFRRGQKKKKEKNTQSINGDCLELMASLGDRPSIFLIIKF